MPAFAWPTRPLASLTSSVFAGVVSLAFVSAPATARADGADTGKHSEPSSPTTWHGKPLWLDANVGWQSINLNTFKTRFVNGSDSLTADIVPQNTSGPTVQLGVGARLWVLTFGVRGGVAWFNDPGSVGALQLYNLDAEVGLRLPFDRFEPYLLVGGGYSTFGGLDDALKGVGRGLDIDGANLRFGGGLDFFLNQSWSVGARATWEVLFLSRNGVALRDVPAATASFDEAQTKLLSGSGSSIGTAINLTVGPALHF